MYDQNKFEEFKMRLFFLFDEYSFCETADDIEITKEEFSSWKDGMKEQVKLIVEKRIV